MDISPGGPAGQMQLTAIVAALKQVNYASYTPSGVRNALLCTQSSRLQQLLMLMHFQAVPIVRVMLSGFALCSDLTELAWTKFSSTDLHAVL